MAAAEAAAATAAGAAAEAKQEAAVAAAELVAAQAARQQGESALQQQLLELRQQRDAEVAALADKLAQTVAACDKCALGGPCMLSHNQLSCNLALCKRTHEQQPWPRALRSVADAERMLDAKDQLLGRWKAEAQLVRGTGRLWGRLLVQLL